jgi:predicted metalloendopeptidase
VLGLVGRPQAVADARAILAVETAVARVQWTPEQNRDAIRTCNKYEVATLNASLPGFDWVAWANVQGIDGGIGAVIGHEIGHGFDDQGRNYDGDGKLRDWWTPADDAEFRKRAKVLVDQ